MLAWILPDCLKRPYIGVSIKFCDVEWAAQVFVLAAQVIALAAQVIALAAQVIVLAAQGIALAAQVIAARP